MKIKKKVLLSSVLTIALCLSLIAGSTFALFTSNSEVNIAVTSGKVNLIATIDEDSMQLYSATPDVNGTLVDENGATYSYLNVTENQAFTNGGTAAINGNALTLETVTPGDKVTFKINLTNNSNIPVQYRVKVACTYGTELFYGLVFGIDGTDFSKVISYTSAWNALEAEEQITDPVEVSVELPISAGNRYQDKTCKIVYTVEAVQGNASVTDDSNQEVLTDSWIDLAAGTQVPEAVNGVITIYHANELAAFAASVNAGNSYKNITVQLANDIDLSGAYWTPIGLNADSANKFQGIFDGQNYTISSLKVKTEAGYTAAGFFGALNGVAKNFTVKNATVEHISTSDATDNGIAVVAGSIYTTGSIDNVHVVNATVKGNRYIGGISGYTYGSVTNCSVTDVDLIATPDEVVWAEDGVTYNYNNGDKVGGVVGYFQSESTYKVSGNTATDVTIIAYRDAGGIVGAGNAGDAVIANEATNVYIMIDQETNHYQDKTANAGAIIGRVMSGTIDSSNISNNIEIKGSAMLNGKLYGTLESALAAASAGGKH